MSEISRSRTPSVEASSLVTPASVAALQQLVDAGTLTDKLARQVLEGVIAGEGTPQEVVDARGLAVVSDDGALIAAIDEALAAARCAEDPRRQGAGRRCRHRRRHEGDEGQADAARVRELVLERAAQ
jgi:aspartyl-tRNA(Asn)/glutamyl-tRNA(Gln) amidotransferase subunit B